MAEEAASSTRTSGVSVGAARESDLQQVRFWPIVISQSDFYNKDAKSVN